jgi:glycosyltransferase involved in cell wall biosynthesis
LSEFLFEIDGQPKKRNPPHCAPIWRRRLHEDHGWFECHAFDFCADFEFWLRVAAAGGKFILLNEPKTLFYAATGTASDRIMHAENKGIIEKWGRSFPPVGYKESHLGRRHDNLHYCMNLNVIFSNRSYYWGLSGVVSVIVLGHSDPDFFQECLESVASQDYCLIDCIIVLDNADVDVQKVARKFSSSDVRFRVVALGARSERNYARNVGLALAIGKWVCFVDGDDLLATGSISSRVSAAGRMPGCIVFGGLEIFNSEGTILENPGQDYFECDHLRLGWPHHCSLLLPNDEGYLNGLLYPARPSDVFSDSSYLAGEDVEFMVRLLKENPGVVFRNSGAPAYRYRRHASSSYSRRHISIGRVISVVVREFGVPSDFDIDYSVSLSRRLLNYVFWNHLNDSEPGLNCVDFFRLSIILGRSITKSVLAESIANFQKEVDSLLGFKAPANKIAGEHLELAAVNAGLFLSIGFAPSSITHEINGNRGSLKVKQRNDVDKYDIRVCVSVLCQSIEAVD